MKVQLLNRPVLEATLEAAQVCRNTDKPEKALDSAINAGHTSLLEHTTFSFLIDGISRACVNQLLRHRIGMSYAQQSQRSVKVDVSSDKWYVTPYEAPPHYHSAMQALGQAYLDCVDKGMPLEDARYLLPNATVTKLVLTANARSLTLFFDLRMCLRAQWEIRELANRIFDLVYPMTPCLFKRNFPNCTDCKERCNPDTTF